MASKIPLKIGHLKITDHLILGVTKAKLAKGTEVFEHCTLETKAMTGWNSIGEALTEGTIDIAFMLAPYAMELFHSGEALKLILFSHKDGSIVVTNKHAGIETIEDFKGKTVLIPYHLSVHHMLFNRLLTEKGLETGVGRDVVFEVVAPSQIPQIIEWDEDGEIGGYIVAEPYGSQVVKAGLGNEFILSKDIWPNHPCCVVVAKESLIESNPEAIQEFTDSLVNSGFLIQEKPEIAAKVGSVFLGQDLDVIRSVLTQPPDRVTTDSLKPVIDDLETMQNYLTNEISAMSGKIDLEEFVDMRFAENAGAK